MAAIFYPGATAATQIYFSAEETIYDLAYRALFTIVQNQSIVDNDTGKEIGTIGVDGLWLCRVDGKPIYYFDRQEREIEVVELIKECARRHLNMDQTILVARKGAATPEQGVIKQRMFNNLRGWVREEAGDNELTEQLLDRAIQELAGRDAYLKRVTNSMLDAKFRKPRAGRGDYSGWL